MTQVSVLDIGDAQITALVAQGASDGRFRVAATVTHPMEGIRKGLVVDIEGAGRAIQSVLKALELSHGSPIESVYVGLRGSHTETQRGQGIKLVVPKGRTVTHQDVMEVINHSRNIDLPADRVIVHVIPRFFRLDGAAATLTPVGEPAGRLEAETLLVTGQTSSLQNLERAVQEGGYELEQPISSALASGLGSLSQEEIDNCTLTVDVGLGTTEIAVFRDGSLAFGASLPVGSGHITSDIAALLKCSSEEAERLKVQFGSALAKVIDEGESVEVQQLGQPVSRPMQRRVLGEIIEARVREMATMTRDAFDRNGHLRSVTHGCVLTGNGARLPDIDTVFSGVLGVRVRTSMPERGTAAALGLAKYAIQCAEDSAPIVGENWRDKVKSLFSLLEPRK